MKYYLFWGMHSGGGTKEPPYEYIYIEAESQSQAESIFYSKFGHNPNRVTCTCCGEDYSISGGETLEQVSAFHRNCAYEGGQYVEQPRHANLPCEPVEEYLKNPEVKFIPFSETTENERAVEVPTQGFVWTE